MLATKLEVLPYTDATIARAGLIDIKWKSGIRFFTYDKDSHYVITECLESKADFGIKYGEGHIAPDYYTTDCFIGNSEVMDIFFLRFYDSWVEIGDKVEAK